MNSLEIVEIVNNEKISDNMYYMGFKSRVIADKGQPGQFVHIKVPDNSSLLLRRPFSINHIDKDREIVYIAYQIIGEGTLILSKLRGGDMLDILGPLGRGFSMEEGIDRVAIIGGGCGIAPLRYIPSYWPKASYTAFLGYRTRTSIYQLKDFENICSRVWFTTDDGSAGEGGFVTDVFKRELDKIRPQLIMACGPIDMLKQVQHIANEKEIACQISLEERMGCGIGACMVCSCAIKVKEGFEYQKVCSDGPVFPSDEVILDENHKLSC